MTTDVLIIGAGLSGAVIAERFANQLQKRVLVLEQRDHIGGNCYDKLNEHNIMVHQYGPHLFHTSKKEVWEYLSQFTNWHPYEHKVLSKVDGKLVPLPFNLNTLEQLYSKEEARAIEQLLVDTYGYGTKVPILELKSSSDQQLRALGQLVYDKFFVNYTSKQWGCKPEEISPAVTARVPVVISRDNRYFHDTYQAIPAEGYSAMFERMLKSPLIDVQLNQNATTRLQLNNDSGVIRFDGSPFNGPVIYTGMLDQLLKYSDGELPYRSIKFAYETHELDFYQPATTVNYPNEENFTRITEFKHILPCDSNKTTIVKEYPQTFDKDDPERNIPYYPVFNEKNQQAYDRYRATLERFANLTVVGRLADYKYYNMDDAVANALGIFHRLQQRKQV